MWVCKFLYIFWVLHFSQLKFKSSGTKWMGMANCRVCSHLWPTGSRLFGSFFPVGCRADKLKNTTNSCKTGSSLAVTIRGWVAVVLKSEYVFKGDWHVLQDRHCKPCWMQGGLWGAAEVCWSLDMCQPVVQQLCSCSPGCTGVLPPSSSALSQHQRQRWPAASALGALCNLQETKAGCATLCSGKYFLMQLGCVLDLQTTGSWGFKELSSIQVLFKSN